MRLIDADALYKAFERTPWFDNADRDIAEDVMDNAPTVNPQPDPITGLVPCGCGGKAVVVPKDNGFYIVCNSCEVSTTQDSFFNGTGFSAQSLDDAKEDWNAAMGYKGGAE